MDNLASHSAYTHFPVLEEKHGWSELGSSLILQQKTCEVTCFGKITLLRLSFLNLTRSQLGSNFDLASAMYRRNIPGLVCKNCMLYSCEDMLALISISELGEANRANSFVGSSMFLKQCNNHKKAQAMKRTRDVPKFTKCDVNADCLIECVDESNEMWTVPISEDLPENVKHEYIACQSDRSKNARARDFEKNQALLIEDSASEDDEKSYYLGVTPDERRDYQFRDFQNCADNPHILASIPNADHTRALISQGLQVPDVKFLQLLGKGSHGIVFTVCVALQQSLLTHLILFAVKYDLTGNAQDAFAKEFDMQERFYNFGLAPKPLVLIRDPVPIIVMNKVDGTLDWWLRDQRSERELDHVVSELVRIIFILSDHNFAHRDMHWGNVTYDIDMEARSFRLGLLDFGYAQPGSNPQLELVQLIRTSFPNYGKDRDETNMRYLRQQLTIIYANNYELPPDDNTYWTLMLKKLRNPHLKLGKNCAKSTLDGLLCNHSVSSRFKLDLLCMGFCKSHATSAISKFISLVFGRVFASVNGEPDMVLAYPLLTVEQEESGRSSESFVERNSHPCVPLMVIQFSGAHFTLRKNAEQYICGKEDIGACALSHFDFATANWTRIRVEFPLPKKNTVANASKSSTPIAVFTIVKRGEESMMVELQGMEDTTSDDQDVFVCELENVF